MRRLSLVLMLLIAAVLAQCATAQKTPGAVVSKQQWGVVWSSPATSKVMRGTAVPGASATGVSISAAANEYEPFQIVLRPSKELKNVRITAHKFVGAKGAQIPAWAVSVRSVGYVEVKAPTMEDLPAGQYPDPLPDFKPMAMPASVNSPVWITIYVPPKTRAGSYSSTVDIAADGIKTVSVPIRLRVWGFELPTVSRLKTAYGVDMDQAARYQAAETLEQKRKVLDTYNLEMWRHRLSPYAPYKFYEIKNAELNDPRKLDFSDFDVAIAKYFPLFNTFRLPGFAMASKISKPNTPEEDQAKIEYMRAVIEHLVDKGQASKGFDYLFDEPTPENYKLIKQTAELARMADSRIKVMVTEQVEPELVGSVDIWCPQLAAYDQERAQARQAKGDEVWWYVCGWPQHPYPNYFIEYPGVDQRILPWMSWKYGVTGILFWQILKWQVNPWEDPHGHVPNSPGFHFNGNAFLFYPPAKQIPTSFLDAKPIPSLRIELIREGMEDYDYFYILQNRITAARRAKRSPALIKKAESALAMVNSCVNSRTEYTKDPSQLDAARNAIAQAIESLR